MLNLTIPRRLDRPRWGDVVSGITNGLVYLPQGIGYAILVGVSPIYGLYAGVFPPLLGALTMASVYVEIVATNELAVPAGRIAQEMGTAFTPQKLFTMTLLVGAFAMIAGVLRLGRIVRYVSASVMTGFVLGIMLLLILGQLRNLTGFPGSLPGNELEQTLQILRAPHQIQLGTLLAGIVTIATTLFLLHTPFRKFAYLISLLGVTLAVHIAAIKTIALTGAANVLPTGFPRLVTPDLHAIPHLLMPSLTLTILGLSFAAGVAEAYPGPDGNIGDPSGDFLGQGIANFCASFFQCLPSCGSMSRTAYLVETGAMSRWAHIFTALTTLTVILTVVHLIEQIPLAAVAGVLMVIGYTAIDAERLHLIWRINQAERWTMLLTAALTLFLSPPLAILAGVVLSFLAFVEASTNSVSLVCLVRTPDGKFAPGPMPQDLTPGSTIILQIQGYLFFAGIDTIANDLQRFQNARGIGLVLSFRGYTSLGSKGLLFLRRFATQMADAGNVFVLADISEEIQKELDRTGLRGAFGEECVVAAALDANESLHAAVFKSEQSRKARISSVGG